MREIASEKGVSPGQLALAWLLHQGEDIVPIPAIKRREYLEENAAAVKIELGDEDLSGLEEAAPRGASAGQRYADQQMRTVNL